MIDRVLLEPFVERAAQAVPSPHWTGWVRYDNDCEHGKRTCNELGILPTAIAAALTQLHSPEALAYLRHVTGITDLVTDPLRHGAGLHVMEPGGWLQVHGDYELHPTLAGMERRLSLLLGLSEPGLGGELLLCDGWGKAQQALTLAPNRALLFENGPASFHGVRPVQGSADRVTLAAYYLAPARPAAVRQRAMFLPNRDGGQCPREVR